MNNSDLIKTAMHSMRNDTVLNKGIVELLCNALAKSEAQLHAVVAENSFLMQRIDWPKEQCPTTGNVTDVDPADFIPATDAAIAALRAEGVEMYAAHLKEKYNGIEYSLIGEYYTNGEEDRLSDEGEVEGALYFSAQLRSQSEQVKGVQHD